MNITEMDVKFFFYLHAVKIATYKQIQRDIYSDMKLKSVCNRLGKMEKLSLISGVQNRQFSLGERLISLTKKGFNQYVAQGSELRSELKSEANNHDIQLVDIRSTFLKLKKIRSYWCENEIQTWGETLSDNLTKRVVQLNSDAVANFAFSGGDILAAIEYEDSEKGVQRYEPIVKKYYLSNDIGAVFYVCKSQNLVRKISEVEKALYPSDKPKIFYQVLSNLTGNDAISFHNFNNFALKFEAK